MSVAPLRPLGDAEIEQGLVGVIDVGSNSVRLVVFEGRPRGRLPIFNEKVLCGLGRHLDRTGRLDRRGVERARETLRRFIGLAERMGVSKVRREIDAGRLVLTGNRGLARRMQTWLGLSPFAVEPKRVPG